VISFGPDCDIPDRRERDVPEDVSHASRRRVHPVRRSYTDVARLMERHGDAKMIDLLQTLANCPKARSANIHDRCRAVFEGLAV
jgi:hypothetical protein